MNLKAGALKDKYNKKVVIIIVVIVVIIVMSIMSLMLYPEEVEPDININTTNRINFEKEPDEPGTYHATVVKATYTELIDFSLVITDDSNGRSISMDPLHDMRSIEIIDTNDTSGLNCTFLDVDNDNRLSRGDRFIINMAEHGDTFELIYKPNGNLIVTYIFY